MPGGTILLQARHTQKKRVPKQCPWGAIATNSTLFLEGCFFSFIIMFVGKTPTALRAEGTILQKKCP